MDIFFEFLGEVIALLSLGILFLVIVISRCFSSPVFWLLIAAGVGWFVFARIHAKKLLDADPERAQSFKKTRRAITFCFWVLMIVAITIINVFAGPIRFM